MKKNRKGSLIKPYIDEKRAVFISLDLEHGGPRCGITQISCVLFTIHSIKDEDEGGDGESILGEFDSYVKLPSNAIWEPMCMDDATGLSPSDERILNAPPIEEVWSRLCSFLFQHINK
jgi:hypothetical protein